MLPFLFKIGLKVRMKILSQMGNCESLERFRLHFEEKSEIDEKGR